MKFEPGHKKVGGKEKGTSNLVTRDIKEAYRLHNLELSSGFKILNELESEGKITLEK